MHKSIALVCASNQNRSVEAHALFKKKGYDVSSYGTSSMCKLPGPSIDKPNTFPFGTPYSKMHESLKAQNAELYRQNGILNMLERNMSVKPAPERWQEATERFEIVLTFDQRVFDTVVEDLQQREPGPRLQSVHIINLPVKDTHDEATVGAIHALQLVKMINERADEWEDYIEPILDDFEQKTNRKILHTMLFY